MDLLRRCYNTSVVQTTPELNELMGLDPDFGYPTVVNDICEFDFSDEDQFPPLEDGVFSGSDASQAEACDVLEVCVHKHVKSATFKPGYLNPFKKVPPFA